MSSCYWIPRGRPAREEETVSQLVGRWGKGSEDCTCSKHFFDTEAFLVSSDKIMYGIWSFFKPLPFFCWFWHVAASCVLCLSFWDALLVAGLHNWSSSLITLLSTGAWKRSRWELLQSSLRGGGKAVCILTQVRLQGLCTHWLTLLPVGRESSPQLMSSSNVRDHSALLSCHLLLVIYCHFIPVLFIWTFEFLKNRSLIEHVSKSHDPQVENMTLRELALQEL